MFMEWTFSLIGWLGLWVFFSPFSPTFHYHAVNSFRFLAFLTSSVSIFLKVFFFQLPFFAQICHLRLLSGGHISTTS